jgi:hypothetical protein
VPSSGLRCATVSIAIAAAIFAAPASAQTDPALEARAEFERGVGLTREERWAEALEAFRRSRSLVERPSTVYNIATTLQRLGRIRDAVDAIDEYLAIADPARDAEQRAQAERLREVLMGSIAAIAIEVAHDDAEISLDGRVVPGTGRERVVRVDPGEHVLTISAPRRRTERIEIALGAGAREERSVTLAQDGPDGPIAPPVAEPDPTDAPTGRSIAEEPALWIVIGSVVLVGAGVAIGVGVATGSQGTAAPYLGTASFQIEALRF